MCKYPLQICTVYCHHQSAAHAPSNLLGYDLWGGVCVFCVSVFSVRPVTLARGIVMPWHVSHACLHPKPHWFGPIWPTELLMPSA